MAAPILSSLYGAGVSLRNAAYDSGLLGSYRSSLKIICVGNITTGGSGKSPLTQAIALMFQSAGAKPVILLRGYGGSKAGPLLVTTRHTPEEVGDEACMHRDALESVPVVVSRKRVAGVKLIEEQRLGKFVILDDGFQHRALQRNVNLLLFDRDALADCESGALLPSGNLREPVSTALRRANAVMLVQRGESIDRPQWLPSSIPAFNVSYALKDFVDLKGAPVKSDALKGKKAVAIASIARPAQFFQMLRSAGLSISEEIAGKDHEHWDSRTVDRLNQSAADIVVTTSKDAVKLTQLTGLQKMTAVARLSVSLPDTFQQWLLTTLS